MDLHTEALLVSFVDTWIFSIVPNPVIIGTGTCNNRYRVSIKTDTTALGYKWLNIHSKVKLNTLLHWQINDKTYDVGY